MAFIRINKTGLAGAKDIAKLKKAEGYLLSVEFSPAKIGKGGKVVRRSSAIYVLQQKDGTKVNIWGNAEINTALLSDEMPESVKGKNAPNLLPEVENVMVRLTFKGRKKIPGRSQPMKLVDVEADPTNKLDGKVSKTYKLKNGKFRK